MGNAAPSATTQDELFFKVEAIRKAENISNFACVATTKRYMQELESCMREPVPQCERKLAFFGLAMDVCLHAQDAKNDILVPIANKQDTSQIFESAPKPIDVVANVNRIASAEQHVDSTTRDLLLATELKHWFIHQAKMQALQDSAQCINMYF